MNLQSTPISAEQIQQAPHQPRARKKVATGTDKTPNDERGDIATARVTRQLADEYRKAADRLFGLPRKDELLSLAPWRLLAIHAIELYLNAFLVSRGANDKALRCMQHNFGERARMAIEAGLVLRHKTAKHLSSMTEKREYVISRYGPGTKAELSEITRITATLNEVATKVAAAIAG